MHPDRNRYGAPQGRLRLWIFRSYPDRDDNLICAAAVLEDEVIIKTVMHHFELKENEP